MIANETVARHTPFMKEFLGKPQNGERKKTKTTNKLPPRKLEETQAMALISTANIKCSHINIKSHTESLTSQFLKIMSSFQQKVGKHAKNEEKTV